MLALSTFSLSYVPTKAIKDQALADFLANHPCIETKELSQYLVSLRPWTLHFDGLKTSNLTGVGVQIRSPDGKTSQFSFKLEFGCSNNQAKYKA